MGCKNAVIGTWVLETAFRFTEHPRYLGSRPGTSSSSLTGFYAAPLAPHLFSGRCSGNRRFLEFQLDLALVVHIHDDVPALRQPSEQQLIRQRFAYRLLNQTRHRARTH